MGNRKTFRESVCSFEEQAAIKRSEVVCRKTLFDIVTVENSPPIHNKDYKGGLLHPNAELLQLYHLFMYEFERWHEELQSSRSSSTLEEN